MLFCYILTGWKKSIYDNKEFKNILFVEMVILF